MPWKPETVERKSKEWAEIAADYSGLDFDGLEEKLRGLYDTKELMESQLKPVNCRIEVIEAMFAERFAEQDLKSLSFNSGYKLGVKWKRDLITKDKAAFIVWLKANGMEDELTVYAQRLKGIAKGVLEETGKLPDGVVESEEPHAVVSYTKAK
jgi:hypothetical protein